MPVFTRHLRGFALAALLGMLTACASVQVAQPTAPSKPAAESRDPSIAEAARLAELDLQLAGQARDDNTRALMRLLAGLDDAVLQREAAAMDAADPLYAFAGRALIARGLPLPKPFARTGDWRYDASHRPPAESDGYRPPVKLAVLLPLTGDLSTAAAPVRDGFLAGYYGETRRRPELVFYDTAEGGAAAYDRAVADGSDFVVGPLGRDEVSALFARGALQVPVLALNRGNARAPAGSASFSLSPEDEGIAAAEYLLGRGIKRVLVIGGADETQRRTIAAFREQLTERGGTVTDTFGEGTADFLPAAQREGGVEGIFLATRGSSARTLVPRLNQAGLIGKPIVATSALVSGTGKPAEDAALDGIAYLSEAWSVRGAPGLPPASTTAAQLATARGPAARLFAFGFDAWRVTAYLEHLAATGAELPGATGTLRIDGFGNVLRMPAWSTFSGGVPVPLTDGR